MDTIQVVNVRTLQRDEQKKAWLARPGSVYVGRSGWGWEGGALANPHRDLRPSVAIAKFRADLVAAYRASQLPAAHLHMTPWQKAAMDELYRLATHEGPIQLGCWCAPMQCHADVIARAILRVREDLDLQWHETEQAAIAELTA